MPDLYSHITFVNKEMADYDYDFNQALTRVASQGPDPMYFNVFTKERTTYIYYADRMHDTNTRMLLSNMVKHTKSHLNKDTYSFLFGFLSHYALDVVMHPYVYYNVGDYDKNKPETQQYRGLHKKFETNIDRQIIEEDGLVPRKIKFYKEYFTLKELPRSVIDVMDFTLLHSYGLQHGGNMYNVGVNKMYKNIRYFAYDRFGFKKAIYSILDIFNKGNLFFKDISYFNYDKSFDYANSKKNTWHHPITNEASNLSVRELYQKASQFFKELMTKVDAYINSEPIDLDDVFTNLSFNSGMECTCTDNMTYFKKYK